MHEFSIAAGIIENVLSEAEKHSAVKVARITLEIGKLSMINFDQLEFALGILAEGTIAEGAKIELLSIPVRVRCKKGHESPVELEGARLYTGLAHLKCPVCGDGVEITGGRECMIKEIDVVK